MGRIDAGPHYEIHSTELAKWLEQQASDCWWNIDGDPLLTGRLSIPCPSDELATELRSLDRPLLVDAGGESEAKGQLVDAMHFARLGKYKRSLLASGPLPPWGNDRFFHMCWKGSSRDWLLIEDSVSANQFLEDASPRAK